MRLFKRQAKLTVIRLSTADINRTKGSSLEISEARIAFDVKKTTGSEPNKCTIKVYNLAPTTRAELEQKPLRVILHGGYDGVLKLLALGDLDRGWSEQDSSTDVVTTLEVGDGLRAYSHARVTKAYRPPITLKQIISDAAKSMQLPLPPLGPEFNQTLPSGFSANGPTRDLLEKVLSPLGYTWSSQNGKLVILKDGGIRPGTGFLLSPETGLIGHPGVSPPDWNGKSEVKCDNLLYPELEPHVRGRVDTTLHKSTIRLIEVNHTGDTEGSEFKTAVVGKMI